MNIYMIRYIFIPRMTGYPVIRGINFNQDSKDCVKDK